MWTGGTNSLQSGKGRCHKLDHRLPLPSLARMATPSTTEWSLDGRASCIPQPLCLGPWSLSSLPVVHFPLYTDDGSNWLLLSHSRPLVIIVRVVHLWTPAPHTMLSHCPLTIADTPLSGPLYCPSFCHVILQLCLSTLSSPRRQIVFWCKAPLFLSPPLLAVSC